MLKVLVSNELNVKEKFLKQKKKWYSNNFKNWLVNRTMSGKLWTYQRYGCSERTVKMTMSGKLVTLTIQLLRKNSKQNHVWETGHINDVVAQKEQFKKNPCQGNCGHNNAMLAQKEQSWRAGWWKKGAQVNYHCGGQWTLNAWARGTGDRSRVFLAGNDDSDVLDRASYMTVFCRGVGEGGVDGIQPLASICHLRLISIEKQLRVE